MLGRTLFDFSLDSVEAASSAEEAASAFGTTFGDVEQLGTQLERNANLFGLTSSEANN